jgi:hypothetical protein
MSSAQGVDKLMIEYVSSLEDNEEASIFWIALAAIQWKLGRLEDRTKQEALRIIESGRDLERWENPRDRNKRSAILEKLRKELLSENQPEPRRVPRAIKAANDWSLGEVIGFRLLSGRWILLRVISHHTDKGGRSAVCALLDWVGEEIPPPSTISNLGIKREQNKRGISQCVFQEPRKKRDQARILRLGIVSRPAQDLGGYTVLVWPYVDHWLEDLFELK